MFLIYSGPSLYLYLNVQTRLVKKARPASAELPARFGVQKAKLNSIKNINTAYTNKLWRYILFKQFSHKQWGMSSHGFSEMPRYFMEFKKVGWQIYEVDLIHEIRAGDLT